MNMKRVPAVLLALSIVPSAAVMVNAVRGGAQRATDNPRRSNKLPSARYSSTNASR
jgi:hypothetical protein